MNIKEIIKDKKITLITDYHVSGDEVYNIEDTYILKISKHKDRLLHEKKFNDLLIDKLPVCKSIAFEEKEDKAYYLKECIKGKNLCHETILSNPDRLIDILVKVVNLIHNLKNENNESFIHGDLCLPNILVDDKDNVVGIIDLAHSSFSNDLWLDYAWLIWSFEYNLNSKEHTSKLLEKLNITFDENKYNKVINQ